MNTSRNKYLIALGVLAVIFLILYFVFDAKSKAAEQKANADFDAAHGLTTANVSQTNSTNTNNPTMNNSTPLSTQTTADGLKIDILKQGTGDGAKAGDTVTVQYIGTLTDGTKFDSSYDHGQAFSFKLGAGGVIKGWDEGLVGMKAGEERKLTIPGALGYGAAGNGPIPPNATLVFDVQMVSIAH